MTFGRRVPQLIAATFPNTYLPECEYLTRTLSNDLDLFLAQRIEVGVTAKAKVAWPATSVRRHGEIPERSPMEGLHPVLRVLPRR
jgi:hypothetical protein